MNYALCKVRNYSFLFFFFSLKPSKSRISEVYVYRALIYSRAYTARPYLTAKIITTSTFERKAQRSSRANNIKPV